MYEFNNNINNIISIKRWNNMITCSVYGGLNDPNNTICEHCGSDLIDESESMNLFYDDDDNDNNTSFFDSSDGTVKNVTGFP